MKAKRISHIAYLPLKGGVICGIRPIPPLYRDTPRYPFDMRYTIGGYSVGGMGKTAHALHARACERIDSQ